MKQDLQEKIKQCKALQNMTVEDIIKTDRFRDNLAAYWTAQKEDREAIRKSYEAMRKAGGAKGMKIPAHPIDHLRNLTTDDLAFYYIQIFAKRCLLPAAQRLYIQQICGQAYALTVAQYVVDEFPELESELLPKKKAN